MSFQRGHRHVADRAAGRRPDSPAQPKGAPAAVPSPEPAADARPLDEMRLPVDRIASGPLAAGAAGSLLLAGTISALTGLAPDVLVALYVAPVMLVATRAPRVVCLTAAVAAAVAFAVSAQNAGVGSPVPSAIGVLVVCVFVILATQRALRIMRRRAAQHAALMVELRRSNAELEQFAYVTSHDLSAPLQTVTAFATMLSGRYAGRLDAEADTFLEHITAGTARMQVMIDDLLLLARAGRVELGGAPFELSRALDDVRESLTAVIAERGAEVIDGALPAVHGDERRIVQVLQNLVANAIKFCPPDRPPVVEVKAARLPAGWRIDVRDNGIGLDPRFAARIFGMFQRLHPADEYAGTGIGLAVCQRIVERHVGRIWADSAEGGGSTFSFTLPDRA